MQWGARFRRWFCVHFTPTSASWINQVERWFAELTRKKLRRGVHTSTKQLEADIRAFSSVTTKSQSHIDGPNSQMTFSRRLSASVRKPSRHYAANFRLR